MSPQAALVDQPVAVTVQGLPAGARTTLTARAKDTDGITWSATAQFQATPAGEVSLGQPSLGGSYTGVNPMGLFTLMAPPPGSAPAWFLYPEAGYDVTLQASVGGRVAANGDRPPARPGRGRRGREASCARPRAGSTATCTCPSTPQAGVPRCWCSAAPAAA